MQTLNTFINMFINEYPYKLIHTPMSIMYIYELISVFVCVGVYLSAHKRAHR